MGYYIKVEPQVRVYVEDLNPTGKQDDTVHPRLARGPQLIRISV